MRRARDTPEWTFVFDRQVDLPTQRSALLLPTFGAHRMEVLAKPHQGIYRTSHGGKRDTSHRVRYPGRGHTGVECPTHDKALHSAKPQIILPLPHVRESCARAHAIRWQVIHRIH